VSEPNPLSQNAWANRIVGWDVVDPDQLLANPKNYRRHPGAQREALRGSLNDLGWIAPVIVNRLSGHLIDGHARVEEALTKGSQVPVAYVELTDAEEAEALAVLDPISAMATVDKEALDSLLREVATGEAGLQQMLADLAKDAGLYPGPKTEDPGAQIDKADELRQKWGTERGQIWQVGRHRVMCADSTDEAPVQEVMGGNPGAICWTDPPRNVAYGESNHPSWRRRSIANDNLGGEFRAFASQFCITIAQCLVPGAPIYMAMGAQEWPTIDSALRGAGFHWSSTIIWVKDHAVLSRKDYHTRYEPLWYGWKEGAPRLVQLDDRTQNDVWEIDRPTRSDEHPIMKPVELVARALHNSSRVGDVVFDPFLGSGTTAVAAEQTGRICYGMDIEPKYVAVSLERLAGMGLEARLTS
jgi:DNA modification methylase